jgi:uncharacterized protein
VIQTNALLLDDEWCVLLKELGIEVRVSIDGPAFIHDKNRRTWANTDTFTKVLAGVESLKRNKLPLSTISVLTQHSLDYPQEMFEFFASLKADEVQFNLEEIEGENSSSTVLSSDESTVVDKYKNFFSTFYDLHRAAKNPFVFRNFTILNNRLNNVQKDPSTYPIQVMTQDKAMITILKNGDISTYGPEWAGGTPDDPQKFIIGNILEPITLDEVFSGSKYRSLQKKVEAGFNMCKSECDYFSICGGGNPANKFYETGSIEVSETQYCKIHIKAFADLYIQKLESF